MIKIAFFDIDGTVISHKTGHVPESTAKAFEAMRAEGIRLFTCTGRSMAELIEMKPLEVLHFDGHALMTGHYCYDEKAVIFDCPMRKEDVASAVSYAEKHKISMSIVTKDSIYINFYNEIALTALKAVESPPPPLGDVRCANQETVYQITAYLTGAQAASMKGYLPHSIMTSWNTYGVDFTDKGGSKGIAVAKILEYYGLGVDECIGFGDGENDLGMMSACGISVCLGNGEDRVKKAADYVTDDIDRDGLAKALIHYGVLDETFLQ